MADPKWDNALTRLAYNISDVPRLTRLDELALRDRHRFFVRPGIGYGDQCPDERAAPFFAQDEFLFGVHGVISPEKITT